MFTFLERDLDLVCPDFVSFREGLGRGVVTKSETEGTEGGVTKSSKPLNIFASLVTAQTASDGEIGATFLCMHSNPRCRMHMCCRSPGMGGCGDAGSAQGFEPQ